jgi:hypothetical protein
VATPGLPVPATNAKGPLLRISPGFIEWLASSDCSLALSTYQAGRLIMIGWRTSGALRAHQRLLEQCRVNCAVFGTRWSATPTGARPAQCSCKS